MAKQGPSKVAIKGAGAAADEDDDESLEWTHKKYNILHLGWMKKLIKAIIHSWSNI